MRVVCPYCFNVNNVPKKDEYIKANCGHCKESLKFDGVLDVYDANFDELVQNSQIPVIVYFWGEWSEPCKTMVTEYAVSAKNFPIKAIFTKINTQEEHDIASRFDVRSAPTIIIFKDSKEIYRVSGALKERGISSLVESFLD